MELLLNDVKLHYYTKETEKVKNREAYNKILEDNVVNHIYSEGGGSVASQVELITILKEV